MKNTNTQSQFVPVSSFDIIVFGAVGDLSMRKLIPSLFHRWRDKQIPSDSKIIGVSRTALSSDGFRTTAIERFRELHPEEVIDEEEWSEFSRLLHYCQLDAGSADADWSQLQELLSDSDQKKRVFYLALPPGLYGAVSESIAAAGLASKNASIVLEKPIGKNLESAQAVNEAVGAVFDEHQIFRIDHYLGKETVQNLIVLRFMNSMFEPIWNANAIDHVEITVAESIGVGERTSYYDGAGALRDMVQNHLLQLLCLVAMEPPLDLLPHTVRDKKIDVLRALRPITAETVRETTVRGQYKKGVADSEVTLGYVEEHGAESNTETFVGLKAHIDNWRWKGVPFYLRTGKRMSGRFSEIIIQFKDVAHSLAEDKDKLPPTRLVIRLQPDEGVKLLLVTKDPGPGGMRLRYVPLNLSYADAFEARYPDAYERLLMAVVREDLGLFMRRDEVEQAWRWVDGILSAWEADATPLYAYGGGADGPAQSEMMMDRDGRAWWTGS